MTGLVLDSGDGVTHAVSQSVTSNPATGRNLSFDIADSVEFDQCMVNKCDYTGASRRGIFAHQSHQVN